MGLPARKRKRRSLPPGVLDISAPQHSLTTTPGAPPPSPPHPTPPPHQARPLTKDEQELVTSLRSLYDFRGAETFVRRYGVEVVTVAVRDMRGQADVRNPAAFLRWLVGQEVGDGDRA